METYNNLIPIASMHPKELTETLELKQLFRGKQIFQWIARGADSFEKMTNLPQDLRNLLCSKAVIFSSKISQKLTDPDGTVKLQLTLQDENCIETVLLTDIKNRKTACVSCQAGCAMKCSFCKTGTLGFKRNLTPYEIVEQFLHLERECGKLDNIVFMGMGEPMLNLDAVRKAISILTDENGRGLSARRITLSTCGIIKGIYDLADNGPKIRLAVSLTTANKDLREKIMPITQTNPLPELKKAIEYFIKKSGKRCTLEAVLIGDKNTDKDAAENLIKFAKNMDVHINLIPWNPVKELSFKEPTKAECKKFFGYLNEANLKVTFRTKKGEKIGGACGQLGKIKI
ncbi:MAG: 23S rRNA (adenine(2503)-C(2))-methyltransferase RlmN [Treponemataceae bacterium]